MVQESQPDNDSSTPIPWTAREDPRGFWRLRGAKGPSLAEFDTEADAILAVRAVNNHAKLLKALKSRGCEFSTAEYPPCIDEQPARQSWCKTCDAIEEAQS